MCCIVPAFFTSKVNHWYQYVCEDNGNEYLPAFQELLEFDYHLWDEIRSLRSRKDFLRMGRDFLIFYNRSDARSTCAAQGSVRSVFHTLVCQTFELQR